MAVTTQPPEVRVALTEDASEARLIVPAELERFRLTAEHCVSRLEAAGVELTEEVERAVKQVVHRAQEQSPADAVEAVVASGKAAVAGRDGWVEWYVDESEPEPEPADEDDEEGICHYSRTAFTFVRAEQVVGRVHAPTPGEPGRDVTGQVLEASDGEAVELELDESIVQGPEGELTAQVGGVLVREGNRVRVEPVLRVESDVDFSTGNVDFDGDVTITGGVRDRFLVRSTGHLEVHGLIEAATIEAQGDLHAKGGFAGRERGNAHVGGTCYARYLDNIFGNVYGDLVCEREIINCELTIHGRVRADRGAIIGGRLNVTGPVDVGLLGAPAGTPTELIIGRVPRLEPFAEALVKRVGEIKRRLTVLEKEQRNLKHNVSAPARPAAELQRRIAAVEAELAELAKTHEKAQRTLDHLREVINAQRTIHVNVEKRLAPGVVLIVGHQQYHFTAELRGPVEIRCTREGTVVLRQGNGEAKPLEEVAEMRGE